MSALERRKKLQEILPLVENNKEVYKLILKSLLIYCEEEEEENKIVEQGSTMLELKSGIKVWVLNPEELDLIDFNWHKAKFHRDNDLPAVECPGGTKWWYQNGKLHRDNDLPAVVYPSGTREWYQNGKLHRDNDLPAFVGSDGSKQWRINGERHRYNDLPAVEHSDGSKEWWVNGKFVREE